jgi:hypothetical protein
VLTPSWDAAGAATICEVMALAFVQLYAVLDTRARPGALMKTAMPVVARHSMYEIRAELSPRLQAVFRDQRQAIGELFEETFLKLLPDFAQR